MWNQKQMRVVESGSRVAPPPPPPPRAWPVWEGRRQSGVWEVRPRNGGTCSSEHAGVLRVPASAQTDSGRSPGSGPGQVPMDCVVPRYSQESPGLARPLT